MLKAVDAIGHLSTPTCYLRGIVNWLEHDDDGSFYESKERFDEQIEILQEILLLLERFGDAGKRSADQLPITDFFLPKRQRIERCVSE